MSMEYSDILKNNIENKLLHKPCEKLGHDLDDVRVIYRRCKGCGKFVVCPDSEFIKKRGESGRG
jgi:Pyruvate/2-oxoacid:ferredoxin oxidoreductase delta subunit